jgi:hypothetical protein
MTYRPAIFTLAWRRDRAGRPMVLYSGADRLEGLEILNRALESGWFTHGRVCRADGSPLFIVDPPIHQAQPGARS